MKNIKYTFALLKIFGITLTHNFFHRKKHEYYFHKGKIWADIGHHELAVKNYKQALGKKESGDVYAALGRAYAVLDLKELSLENYRRAYQNHPTDSAGAAMGLAYAEGENGHYLNRQKIIENIHQTAGDEREAIPDGFDELEKKIFAERAN